MIRKRLIFLFCLGSFQTLLAQQTLSLKINKLEGSNIFLSLDKTKILQEHFTLKLGKNWTLNITNDSSRKCEVIITNTEVDGASIALPGSSASYAVNSRTFQGGDFKFQNNFKIEVKSQGNTIKLFNLKYEDTITNGGTIPGGGTEVSPANIDSYSVGSAVLDAYYLKGGTDKKRKLKILAFYAEVEATKDNVINAYKDNKFLNALSEEVTNFPGEQSNKSFGNLSSAFASLGGLDVTTLADGVARFMVKRTKEELNAAFFEKLKEHFTDPNYKDLHTIFPQTYRAINIMGDDIYKYEGYIQTLRENFKKDLRTIPDNLPTIIDNHRDFFNEHPELAATLRSSVYIGESLRDKIHPGDIIADFPEDYLNNLKLNWNGALKTLKIFSASLRDPSQTDSTYWVSSKEIKKLLSDSDVFSIYLGLIYQQSKVKYNGIPFAGNTTFVGLLDKVSPVNFKSYQNYIIRFVSKTDRLTSLIHNYSKPFNDSLAVEQYYTYFKSTIDLIEYSTHISDLPFIEDVVPNLQDTLRDYFEVANTTADLILDVNRRNYSSAVTNTVHIYDLIKTKVSIKNIELLESKLKSKAVNNGPTVIDKDKIKQDIKEEKAKVDVMHKLFVYGSFMSNVVMANSSEEVEKAIEAVALPSGSSRIKRETSFNVSLNGYLGLFTGKETIKGVPDNSAINTYGISAPIGVAISRGNIFNTHASSSIFISLIDLGAVASFRFQDDKTEEVPTIKLQDIISPGIFYSLGLGKTPLSLNIGYQVGPILRKVSPEINDYSNQYSRVSISLVVDIPFINFYTKSR